MAGKRRAPGRHESLGSYTPRHAKTAKSAAGRANRNQATMESAWQRWMAGWGRTD